MSVSTKEQVTTSNTTDEDDLTHVFCSLCMRKDRQRAKKPAPFCGKQKEGPWEAAKPDKQVCQMCVLLAKENPCPRCGFRSIV